MAHRWFGSNCPSEVEVDVTLILADSAQQDGTGKVSALGMGWSITGTPTQQMALVLLIKVPWNETNETHKLEIQLVDSDGHAAVVGQDPNTGEAKHIKIEGDFEAGRPPGIPRGMSIDQSLAMNIGPGLQLQSGQIYEWRLEIDGEHRENWSARFAVR